MTPAPKLAMTGLQKRFGAHIVLDGVDLDVQAGRSLVVIGGSGQGKSVTIKIAAGLMRADAGEVYLDGEPLSGLSEKARLQRARKIGFLFQGAALFDSLPIWRNVAFRLIYADKAPAPLARERALEAMERVGLSAPVADLFPGDLSGGMQKRAGLARAIVANPEIIFFDEPTTGLDPVNAGLINNLIVEQVQRLGCTAVSITHDLESARRIGDDIAMLHNGKIVWRGPSADLDRSGVRLVEDFVAGRPTGAP